MSVKIPGYELSDLIYNSSKTRVFRGVQIATKQAVIIRYLINEFPNQREIHSFENSIELVKRCSHPQIIKPVDFGCHENIRYIIYNDNNLIDLTSYLTRQPHHRLSINQFLTIAIQIAEIFSNIHDADIIFKDLHPGNLLIDTNTRRIFISDFEHATGVSREHPSIRPPTEIEGVISYISPEQSGRMNTSIDSRSDIYSIGVCFFLLLTGEEPFCSTDAIELIHHHITTLPRNVCDVRSDLPTLIGNIVSKLLSKAPQERYQSCAGLAADLKTCLDEWQSKGQISSFLLGSKDFYDHLEIAPKLYGRKKELDILQKAFRDTEIGNPIIISVSGQAGVGKTSIINELIRSSSGSKNVFLYGKYDANYHSRPYAAIIDAIRAWIQLTLSLPKSQLTELSSNIEKSLGKTAPVVSTFVPELKYLIGEQSDSNPTPEHYVSQHFLQGIATLIRLITQKTQLTLFIDDIQWADSASLNTLLSIAELQSIKMLLVLGYRDSEDNSRDDFVSFIECLGALPNYSNIDVTPLTKQHIIQLVEDTFKRYDEGSLKLSELIYFKTAGNAFFLQHFIKQLYHEDLVYFNRETMQWDWQIEKIEHQRITDNVVDLLISSFESLPKFSLLCLQIGACIGQNFSLKSIALIHNHLYDDITAEDKFEDSLVVAINQGFIVYSNQFDSSIIDISPEHTNKSICYSFSHDRIYQAIYESISLETKSAIHRAYGLALLPFIHVNNNADLTLLAAEQLRHTDLQKLGEVESTSLIALFLNAANFAKAKGSFDNLLAFATLGIKLLGADCWQALPDITKQLKSLQLQGALFSKSKRDIAPYFKELRENIADPIEYGQLAYRLSTVGIYTLHRNSCSQEIFEALIMLGHSKIIATTESKQKQLDLISKLEDELEATDSDPILGKLQDGPKAELTIMLLAELAYYNYIANNNINFRYFFLLTLHHTKQYGFENKHGVIYALNLTYLFLKKDFHRLKALQDESLEYLYKNIRQLDKPNSGISEVCVALGSHVLPYTSSLAQANEVLEQGFQFTKTSGETVLVPGLLGNQIINEFYIPVPLTTLVRRLDQLDFLIKRYNSGVSGAKLYRHLVNLLQNKGDIKKLYEEGYSQKEWLLIKSTRMHVFIQHLRLQYYFWSDDYSKFCEAEEQKNETDNHGDHGFITYIEGELLQALMHCRHSYDVKHCQVVETLAVLEDLTTINPEMFIHKHLLLKSELEYIKTSSIHRFILSMNEAEASASSNGFIQYQAFINERLGDILSEHQIIDYALLHYNKALSLYSQWQCKLKENSIEEKLLNLNKDKRKTTNRKTSIGIANTSAAKRARRQESLDITSIIKSNRQLSIHRESLKDLAKSILAIIIENSAAQQGAFFSYDRNEPIFVNGVGLSDLTTPIRIVNLVSNTKEPLIIGDLKEDLRWCSDKAFENRKVCSLLCMPIIYKDSLLGAIYLENNLIENAFSAKRIMFMESLLKQASISIINALKSKEMQASNIELSQSIDNKTSHLEAINRELNSFGQYISLDLKSPVRKIQGFAEAVIEDHGDTIDSNALNYLQRIDKSSRKMTDLIGGLGALYQYSAADINNEKIKLSNVVNSIITDLSYKFPNHHVATTINNLGSVNVDYRLVRIVFYELISNAWKFSQTVTGPQVEIGRFEKDGNPAFYIRDNGIGFDMRHSDYLFNCFQRLHADQMYDGHGIGLATARLILGRYHGSIWAESEPNKGATFYFTFKEPTSK